MPQKFWLMKSEPDVFSFDDLLKAPSKTTCWEGVRNYQARNFMRDDFQIGDGVLFYHSNSEEAGVYGTAAVVKIAYPDHFAYDKKSDYFDEDAWKKQTNPWVMVDIKAQASFKQAVTRPLLQAEPRLADMMVLKKGSRLSVQPVSAEHFQIVAKLGGL
jgi:predicted RNA-binding protein with PUA-like domain